VSLRLPWPGRPGRNEGLRLRSPRAEHPLVMGTRCEAGQVLPALVPMLRSGLRPRETSVGAFWTIARPGFGDDRRAGGGPGSLSKDEVRKWAAMNGCLSEPKTVHNQNGVKAIVYSACKEGSEVVFYTIEGMGHTWPGGKSLLPERMVGKTSDKINATNVIWEFFKRHSRR